MVLLYSSELGWEGDSDSDDEDRGRSSGGSKMPEFFKREFKKRRKVITIYVKGGWPSCNGLMSLSKKFSAQNYLHVNCIVSASLLFMHKPDAIRSISLVHGKKSEIVYGHPPSH